MKNEILNKELLSEVYGFKILKLKRLDDIRILNMEFCGWAVICEDSDNDFLITSLSELATKCKEWAYNKKLTLITWNENIHGFGEWQCIVCKRTSVNATSKINQGRVHFEFGIATEPEAIFKACQWIIDNKE